MTTCETFGRVQERPAQRCEYLTLAFSPLSVPLRSRWRNNGLSADFLGDYVVTFLPREESSAGRLRQSKVKHSVIYVANELLENAMKYHQHSESIPIGIHMELTSDRITVSSDNGISREQAEIYKYFIEHLLKEDPGELLLKHLEANAKDGDLTSSGLGLLTMINDYGAELSWRFEPSASGPATITVTTTAVLELTKEAL